MRRVCPLVAVVVMTLAPDARAQPARSCQVTVALAPDDVRREIEAWVAAEPRCERELEVRVVPTDTGLYLSARDPKGRVRERIVPDAQSAAVLVVSWMADDSLGPSLPVGAPASLPVDVSIPSHPEEDDETPPSLGASAVLRSHDREPNSVSFGLIGGERNLGLRGQLDLLSRGRWVVGVGGGVAHTETHDRDTTMRGGDNKVGQARIFIGARHAAGRLSMRAQLGIGVDFVDEKPMTEQTVDGDRMHGPDHVTPALELGLLGSVRLGGAWGLTGGPILHAQRDADKAGLSLFLGIARRL